MHQVVDNVGDDEDILGKDRIGVVMQLLIVCGVECQPKGALAENELGEGDCDNRVVTCCPSEDGEVDQPDSRSEQMAESTSPELIECLEEQKCDDGDEDDAGYCFGELANGQVAEVCFVLLHTLKYLLHLLILSILSILYNKYILI